MSPELAAQLAIFGMTGAVGSIVGMVAGYFLHRPTPADDEETPVRAPALSEAELRAALCVGEDHPLWRAFMQCIEHQRAECVGETLAPDRQGSPLATYYAGGGAHLDLLKRFLREQRTKALKMVEKPPM